MGLSGPFQRLDVLGFKKALKIALQASHTVRQAITPLLLDRLTGCIFAEFVVDVGFDFCKLLKDVRKCPG